MKDIIVELHTLLAMATNPQCHFDLRHMSKPEQEVAIVEMKKMIQEHIRLLPFAEAMEKIDEREQNSHKGHGSSDSFTD